MFLVLPLIQHPSTRSSHARSQTNRVLVVGGGIAGGVLSLGLAQKGVEVILLELRDEMGGVGHGITLQGNALKAFNQVGIFDRLAEHGFPFDNLRMRTVDGHVMAEIPAPPMGGPDVPPTMGAVRGGSGRHPGRGGPCRRGRRTPRHHDHVVRRQR